MDLVRSRQRIIDHGEVFTPRWLVEEMLGLVQSETERVESRFLEPACGSGNFLIPILNRKLVVVENRFSRASFEKSNLALLALMSIYGIEILADNVDECRKNLLEAFLSAVKIDKDDVFAKAAAFVLKVNIVQGDAIKMKSVSGEPIIFPEWGYLGKGKFQRRDFLYDSLTKRSSYQDTLFESFEEHEIFTPIRTFPKMSVYEIASSEGD